MAFDDDVEIDLVTGEIIQKNANNGREAIEIDTKEKLLSVFEMLKGKYPTEENIKKLYEIKEKLGIRENDALWMIIIIFETYNQSFTEYGQELEARIKTFLDQYDSILERTAERADELIAKKFKNEELIFLEQYKAKIISSMDINPKQKFITKFNCILATFFITTICISSVFTAFWLYMNK